MNSRIVPKKGLWIMLLLGLVAVILFTACAVYPEEEGKVVEIGLVGPITGPASGPSQYGLRNTIDYLRYFEEVGIPGLSLPPGVTIKLIWADDAMEIPKSISAYQRFVERGLVFLYIYNPTAAEVLKLRCEKDEMPAISMAATEIMMYPPGWIYAFYPTEPERFAVLADWIMGNWDEEHPPRVVFMGTDTPYGRAAEVQGIKYGESIGMEMLPVEIVPIMPLDTSPQLLRLFDRGVDFIYICSMWITVVPVMKDAERLGLTGKIRFVGYENSQGIALLEALGPTAEGYLAPRAAPWYEEVPFLTDMYMRYRGEIDTQGDGASTLLYGSVGIEAISRAIEEVGYENLDGRAVKEALDTIRDFDIHGMGKPITYTPEDHRGSASVKIYEVQGGKVVPVTDWREAPMLIP